MENQNQKIIELNDAFRTSGGMTGGHVMLTSTIAELESNDRLEITFNVVNFKDFSEENDPNGEHDFGAFDFKGQKVFWKIDYYDLSLTKGSEDPADSDITTRVLTIMFANEY